MIESPQPETAEPIATMRTFAGFVTMCIGMFMAILDVQIVATSLPTIQRALGIAPDEMSWVQTAYLIAEIVAIPLTGFLMRLIGMRRLFGAAVLAFARGVPRLRHERPLCAASRLARRSRLRRRHAHPCRLRRRLPALSAAASGAGDHDRRLAGGPRPDRRADRWRVDHRDLFMALAFPCQCRAGRCSGAGRACAASARAAGQGRFAKVRFVVAGPAGDGSCRARNCAEGSAASRLVLASSSSDSWPGR